MAINPTAIGSVAISSQDAPVVIEMLSSQPTDAVFTPARPAGQVCGYYNGATDRVELYVVNNSGIRFMRVG